jgi:hypothetical protein
MRDEFSSAGKWLAATATYTALVIGVFALPWSITTRAMTIAITILLAILFILIVQIASLNREVKEIRSDRESLAKEIGDLSYAMDLTDGTVALFYSLAQPPDADGENHYFEIRDEYRIDGDDGTYSYYFHGRRTAGGQSTVFQLKISGDTPTDAVKLVPEAEDLVSGERLQVTFSTDSPYLKVLDVMLSKPLEEGESFKLLISLRWAGTFPRARTSDYLFIAWGQYCSEGIDRLTGSLSADIELRNATLEEIDSGKRKRCSMQPKITEQRGRCRVSWAMDNPTVLYLLRFEKVINI